MKESTLRLHHVNVCVNDEFEIDTEANTVRHHCHYPRNFEDIVGAYVLATWDDKRLVIQVSKQEIDTEKEKNPKMWLRFSHVIARRIAMDKMIAELKLIGVWS
jgi:hypothetical protein